MDQVSPPPEVIGLQRAVANLAGLDPGGLSDAELAATVRALEDARDRFDSARLGVLGVFDARRVWAADDDRSASAWVARRCGRSRAEARRDARLARDLRHAPLVAAAFAAGEITGGHVALLGAARRFAPELFQRDEAVLVGHARTLQFDDLVATIAYWRQAADDERAEADARRRDAGRHLSAVTTLHGAVSIQGWLPPVGGAVVRRELRRLERSMFEADWAEARDRLGEGTTITADHLARTSAQRWADALVEMATRSAHVPEGARPRRPLVTVHVDHGTLTGRLCELADGTVITPGQLLPLLTTADIERAVFGPDRRIIELGRRSRLFVGGARRAVEIRDRRCTADGCDAPAEECDVDHVPGWAEGGTTDPDHGRLRCPAHHPDRRRRRTPGAPAEARRATGRGDPGQPGGPGEPGGDAGPDGPGDPHGLDPPRTR